MTDRKTVSTITDIELTDLYDERDRLTAEIAACRKQQWPKQLAAAEDTIARVREYAESRCTAEDANVASASWVLHLLDGTVGEQPAPAATQTTDGQE